MIFFGDQITFHLKSIGTEKHMWTSGFYKYEHIYLRRQEFPNILEKKLENYAIALGSCYLFTKL